MVPAGLRRWLDSGRPGVKICGITREEDAHAAVEARADALGFNFYPRSKRAVRLAEISKWLRKLPEDVGRVAVVVQPDEALLRDLAASGLFHALQFHGGESADFCAKWGGDFYIKACPLSDEASAAAALDDPAPCILLDAHAPGTFGGTGRAIDWSLASKVCAATTRPVVLSGGLNPANVAEALRIVKPAAVDAASGVESAPGIKDGALVSAFVSAVTL
ncbi:MAG: phosphoribosylanthranilate isomerase [Chthoniobacterales bacterium]|nr:phosphoribosylanthranilate isomerase [Chthoniobacterales bacterium]